jgi:hypothetical protein
MEVLQALERQNYDVVLMDVQIPEIDGLKRQGPFANAGRMERRTSWPSLPMPWKETGKDASRQGWMTASASLCAWKSSPALWESAFSFDSILKES